ncbi:YfhH family protein [Desertibacillus haloalkaliphilus]|uniref:YfhH family protein n=1 Tax=Desertibacillus haloalkaliphilus TaxID=1328930 RepID=UPI001C25E316|nr:YfhH family protein [Desertibacillus haloalkaliphilus]MBU8908874.1 YfhH family protein [Desertibacillus haloalkaliphilus]
MEKRYSQMEEHELRQEIALLNEKAKKAEQMGMVSEFAVYERKMVMAKAYLLDPNDFNPEETYILDEDDNTFTISYLNGTFAWGYRNDQSELEAVPISLLKEKVK